MPGIRELTETTLDDQLLKIAGQLGRKYHDRIDITDITDAVYEEAAGYRDARVTQYIPVLVEHAVHEQIRRRINK